MICLLGNIQYDTLLSGSAPPDGRPLRLFRDPPQAYRSQHVPDSRWKELRAGNQWPYTMPLMHMPSTFHWIDWMDILDHAMSRASHYPILLSRVIELVLSRIEQKSMQDILRLLPRNEALLSVVERSISDPLLLVFQGRIEGLLRRIWNVLPEADTVLDDIWVLHNCPGGTAEPLRRSFWMWMQPGLYPSGLVMKRIDGRVDWRVKKFSAPGDLGSHYC